MAGSSFTMSSVSKKKKKPSEGGFGIFEATLLICLTVDAGKIQRAGAWHSCGSSGNFFYLYVVSQNVIFSIVFSSTHNSYMSSQGTQDMCLKRDSKVEATSHFTTCKSLWHVCHILFVKVVTKVHQISRGGHLHLLFCWKSFSIILQEDDVLTYILGWVFLENIVWKGPPSGHSKSKPFHFKKYTHSLHQNCQVSSCYGITWAL